MRGTPGRPDVRDVSRPATPEEYAAWLLWWLAAGRLPTHFYGDSMPAGMLFATEDCFVPSLTGAEALTLLVPDYWTHLELDCGASDNRIILGWRTGDRPPDLNWVPVWKDTPVDEAYREDMWTEYWKQVEATRDIPRLDEYQAKLRAEALRGDRRRWYL